MKDYLGKDQRKTNEDDNTDDKPIQGFNLKKVLLCIGN